jgi:hypothetical protein
LCLNLPGIAAFALLLAGCLFTSCTKKKVGCMDVRALNYDPDAEEQGDKSCVLAGRPGNNDLVVSPQHHGAPIKSTSDYKDTAYVKYNSLEFPGDDPSLYDFIVTGKSGDSSIVITSLKQGNYYIFMAGFDHSINQRVKGGIPYTLTQESGTLSLTVPVTE